MDGAARQGIGVHAVTEMQAVAEAWAVTEVQAVTEARAVAEAQAETAGQAVTEVHAETVIFQTRFRSAANAAVLRH